MAQEFITIEAIDKDSSELMGKTFSALDGETLKKEVEEWEKTIPYRKYELITQDFFEDYSDDVVEALEKLEVSP